MASASSLDKVFGFKQQAANQYASTSGLPMHSEGPHVKKIKVKLKPNFSIANEASEIRDREAKEQHIKFMQDFRVEDSHRSGGTAEPDSILSRTLRLS